MSYCRWGLDGSAVYVYATAYVDRLDKGLVFTEWLCHHVGGPSFTAKSEQEMIEHLLEHRAKGDEVPEYALERLRNERDGKDFRG